MGDGVVSRIHGQLCPLTELAGFAGLYRYAGIRIYGGVMGFIGSVFAVFVVGTGAVVLLQTPFTLTGLYLLQLVLTGHDSLLLNRSFIKSCFAVCPADGPYSL